MAHSSHSHQRAPDPAPDPAAVALRIALPARPGHYDELRDAGGALRERWRQFLGHLGPGGVADFDRRARTVARQIRDDGVTYNVYSEQDGPQRPWSLDLLPFLIPPDEWAAIEAGVAQHAHLMTLILRDAYGAQRLVERGLLPAALVHGSPGYLRPLVGATPVGGQWLTLVAFDLARGPDGRWWMVGNRTQAPSGLGYALQNRLIVARLFPDAFREMRVQRIAGGFRRLLDTVTGLAPVGGQTPLAVLLTPGPYNETYFEHAYLARYLGLPLVEGNDLTVRGEQVFLKTLRGLERVHAIVRRLDDDFCDPLELRADSALGVPGLLQAVRAQQVLIANALGSGFLESPALNGFLPAIAEALLGTPLLLPPLASWWCGEAAALEAVRANLAHKVVKPTYAPSAARPGFEPRIGAELDAAGLARLQAQIDADPEAFTVQDYLPLSQAPAWQHGALVPRAAMVRVFAIAGADGAWQVLPGGLTRVATQLGRVVSMQRGGSSMDTWVQTEGHVDTRSLLPAPLRPEDLGHRQRVVSSRAAENLFWMGRYTERAEFTARLARQILLLLADDSDVPAVVQAAVGALARRNGLVPPGTPALAQAPAVFERTLIAALGDGQGTGVAFNLAAMARAGSEIRDRLSPEHWRLLDGAAARFRADCARAGRVGAFAIDEASAALGALSDRLAAIVGAQSDRMTRDDGWRLLTVGRQIERLLTLAAALRELAAGGALGHEPGADLALGLFDSTITYRSLFQRRLELAPLLDLLLLERGNPRALARVVHVVRRELGKLPGPGADLARALRDEADWPPLAALCRTDADGSPQSLRELLDELSDAAAALSDAVGSVYFSHAEGAFRTVGA